MTRTEPVSPPDYGWDPDSERALATWGRAIAGMATANHLAALEYQRWHAIGMATVAILTLVVGGQGVQSLSTHSSVVSENRVLYLITFACTLTLGVIATIMSSMELKGKCTAYTKRAAAFGALSSTIQVQLLLLPRERRPKQELLEEIPSKVAAIEEIADPLPLRYRRRAVVEADVVPILTVVEARPTGPATRASRPSRWRDAWRYLIPPSRRHLPS